MSEQITPGKIIDLGLGFWGSKALLSAVELGLFNRLAEGAADVEALRRDLGLHERGARDFLDALVALGMLSRDGGVYANTPETDAFLVRGRPGYVGGILEMANGRLYNIWGSLTEALKTGKPQNESKNGTDVFGALYADPGRLRVFLSGMTGISMGAARALAAKFPWKDYRTVADLGCAQGCVPVQLALAHPHLSGFGFDLPVVRPIFEDYAAGHGVGDRMKFAAGDFFKDPLPPADVYVMGHILHDWGLAKKKALIAKAYAALPKGGALVAYDAIIDDDRRTNAFGLLMSVNMLVETHEGFDYTASDARGWFTEAGFSRTYAEHLAGPDSMVVGVK